MPAAPNLVNAEHLTIGFGTRTILDDVSLGLAAGDVIGVVGRNGSGKTTLLRLLTGTETPDSGRVTRTAATSVGYLHQADDFDAEATVRDIIVGGEADHVWAADAYTRAVVEHLLAEIDLDAVVHRLSGGERRRTALVALMLAGHDLLVLDEPTNHLDVEAVDWLAQHLRALRERGTAMLVVSHDRWFLDAVCSRMWEVHDGTVDAYDGGYAAYVLARAERSRQAAGIAVRRKNLLRKELAWLRRGAPARTSKPKFRIDAATELISDEPPPRDRLELQQFATTRLGKDVFDLKDVSVRLPGNQGAPDRVLLDDLTWSIGPGDRIGLVGVNGSGKTTLLRLLDGDRAPDSGRIKRGKTIQIGHLSQAVTELPGASRVLDLIEGDRRMVTLAGGAEQSASTLLEDFGFTGDRRTARIAELSGGERRRLQFLRLLLAEPNVLMLDEPTNDLDIDTLTVVEDHLDHWPGTLIVVSHDRYFLERVCDVTYALMGDGTCVLLPGGVDQYLEHRRQRSGPRERAGSTAATPGSGLSAAETRALGKEISAAERRLERLDKQRSQLHQDMADHDPGDVPGLLTLSDRLRGVEVEVTETEERWLELSERLG